MRPPRRRRAFLDQDGPAHDPMLLGDMAAACDAPRARDRGRRADLRPRRLRRRRHLRDRACRDRAARARRRGRVASCRAASTRATAWRSRRSSGCAGDGVRLLVTVDCGITAVDAVARATELGVDVIVTDHHRPADALPACTRVCTRPSDVSVPRAVRHGRRLQARPGACTREPGAMRPSSRATSTWSPSRRSPTSFRSATRTAASCARACAGCGARRSRACAR